MGKLPKLTIEERILLVLVVNLRYRDEFGVLQSLAQDRPIRFNRVAVNEKYRPTAER